jgi:hypothetical protein
MQSDRERVDAIQAALAPAREGFRTALVRTRDEVSGLAATRTAAEPLSARVAAELGPLGAARIDVDRLADAFSDVAQTTMPAALVSRAAAMLEEMAVAEDGFTVAVGPDESLADAVGGALARIGRAFGAAHVVALAQTDGAEPGDVGKWLEGYPFARWNRRERELAPPLVVTLPGERLSAGGLAEFLDGGLKLVLVIRGPVAPASLVRLISPGLFVAQSEDEAMIRALARWTGPGVVALMPEGAAGFVHAPGGANLADRLTVGGIPSAPRRAVGRFSVAQQEEELAQLRALAGAAEAPAVAAGEGPVSSDPADRLAAWLLSQADLTSL